MPKENHDRTIEVRLAPGGVAIMYSLEVDESRAELDVSRLELPPDEFARITTAAALHAAFLKHVGPALRANLDARLDGRQLELRGADGKRDGSVTDHLRGVFVFRASWTLTPGEVHTFTFRENNYDQEDFDRIQLTLSADPGLRLRQTRAPDRPLLERPPLERKPGDDERLRTASASFVVDEGTASREEERPPAEAEGGGTAEETGDGRPQKLLHLLLDTRRGVVVLLLLAAGFGAAHALTPGHGKTLVAAYLVGAHGTVWHALLLGLMTTLTHTAAVFVLAFLFLLWPAAAGVVYYVQGLVGGLFIAGLGLWLLIQRLTGHADHFHLGGHHHHHHDHAPPPVPAGGTVRGWHLVLLGVRGGLVPCWDAILLLCLAISAKRVGLGVPLLLAFSAGLAGVLVALGVGVVWARDWAVGRFGEGPRARKLVNALPVVSAVVILALGLWLCYDSLHPAAPGH